MNVVFEGRVFQLRLLKNDCFEFRLRHFLFFFPQSLAWYFLSPAVRRRVGPTRTADTAEWCSTGCRTFIFLTNGLRVASYSLEAAFT